MLTPPHSYIYPHTPNHKTNSLFTAASQEILYRHLSQALFCHPTPVGDITLLLECVDRQGQPFFGVTTIRATVDGEGAYAACALSIAPLPPSPVNPTPHVVGTCLLPKPQAPRPRTRSPAMKQEPCFPLLHAYRPPQAATKPERGAAEEEDGPFTCSLKAACAVGGVGGDWGYSSSNWEGSDDTKPRRSRRPSVRAREAEAAAAAAATSGEENEDCVSVVSSVSSGSAGERGGGSARKKRRRVVRPQRPPVVVAVKPEGSLVQFPYLHRSVIADMSRLRLCCDALWSTDRPDLTSPRPPYPPPHITTTQLRAPDGHDHHIHAAHPAHPGGFESVQTGDTSSEDGAADAKEEDEAEEEEDPFHPVATDLAAGAAPRPPVLRRGTSSGNGGSGSYGYGGYGSYRGARRTVEACQSALLSLAATSSAAGAARVVAPPSPVSLPKYVVSWAIMRIHVSG